MLGLITTRIVIDALVARFALAGRGRGFWRDGRAFPAGQLSSLLGQMRHLLVNALEIVGWAEDLVSNVGSVSPSIETPARPVLSDGQKQSN